MLRIFLSILLGIGLGLTAIKIIEVWLMYQLFEMPDSMISNDPESVAAHLELIPAGAKALVVLSQFIGAYVAALVAGLVSPGIRKAALAAGGIILLLTIINLFAISHPAWMTATMPIAGALGVAFGSRKFD